MHSEQHQGTYTYKGFSIYNTDEKEWRVEPMNCSEEHATKIKQSHPPLTTIKAAKKWITEVGVTL